MKTERDSLTFLHLCLLALCAGIFLMDCAASNDVGRPSLQGLQLAVIALFALSALVVYARRRIARYLLPALCLALGAFRFAAVEVVPAHDVSAYLGQDVQVAGTLIEAPSIRERAEGVSYRYTIEVGEVLFRGERKPATGRLYVSTFQKAGSEAAQLPEIGDIIRARGEVKSITSYQNPGQIDFAAQAARRGIRGRLSARQGVEVVRADTHPVLRQIESIRAFYREMFVSSMGRDDASAIFAMLFGGYEGVDPDLIEAFAVTGLIHILSVSGSHITLLVGIAATMGRKLRLPLWAATLVILAAVLVYTALSGFAVPAVRSALMGGLACIALALEREADARRLLAIVAGALLLWEPRSLFDVSFLLSFTATGGLLYLAPTFHRWLSARNTPFFLSVAVSVTLAAQLATLPIMAWYFGRFSISAFVANVVILPLVEIILVLALGAGLLALVFPAPAGIVCASASLLLGVVFEGTRALAHLPYSEAYMAALPAWLTAVYYPLLAVFARPEEEQRAYWDTLKSRGRVPAVIFACIFLAGVLCVSFLKKDEMTVHFIDVGQGDAAVVITPQNHAFMIDTGGTRDGVFDVGARVDVPYLRHHGVDRLDAIFLTHAHEDHAGGAGSVMARIPTNILVTASEERGDYARSMRLPFSSPYLDCRRIAQAGEVYVVDGVRIEILYAPVAESVGERAAGNELSAVVRVSYGDVSFLFTGDLTGEQEAEVLKAVNPQATALKVAHHGSKTSTTEAFLEAVAPRYAVISVGENNSFGHPHPSVIERLEAAGARILRTDRDGAVQFSTDGRTLQVETYR